MSPKPTFVTVSIIQTGSVLFDTPQTLKKLADLTTTGRQAGAQLALFPEAFVGGYPRGNQFGTSLGIRTAEGRDEFRRYFDGAIDVPGPETELIGKSARDNGMYLVTGVIERCGGTLYCTVLFFGPTGNLLGKHRKVMPTALERIIWGQGDGSTLTVIDTPLGKVGSVICWENYMPLLRTAMYAKGVQLYCAPTVDDRDSWIPTMRHIACEGRCFVLSCCQYLPNDASTSTAPLIRGGSCIVSPLGQVLAGPVYDSEHVLTAQLDLADIARGKFDLDVVGHYARADVFQLHVNESPQKAVQNCADSSDR